MPRYNYALLSWITPHLHVDNVFQLHALHLRAMGVRALLLDVDGTLKTFRATAFCEKVAHWAKAMQASGISMCLLSNGMGHRIGQLAGQLDVPFVARAIKPLPFGCHRAIVLAGHLAGLKTILVTPASLDEPWFTGLKRPIERRLLQWRRPCRELPAIVEVTLVSGSGAPPMVELERVSR